MKPLSGLDGAFLNLETPATPMHVGSLHLFDPPPGHRRNFRAAVKAMIASRIHLAPIFRRRLAPMPLQFANPVWIEDEVDLDRHIVEVDLPAPGTWDQLQEAVGARHADVLDRRYPLWQITIFRGLQSKQKAYYIKIHHALLDGQAGMALAAMLFDASSTPTPVPRARKTAAIRPTTLPGPVALAAAAFRHDAAQYVKLLRHLPEVARTLAGMVGGGKHGARDPALKAAIRHNAAFGPRTPLNVAITPQRGFAAASIPLEAIRAVAAASEATVNDVVLALCGGLLRRYLARHGGVPRKTLIATMPISLRDPGNREFTTQATLSLVSLATDIADPLRRLQAVRATAGATKSVAKRAKSVIPTDFPTIGGPWLLGALASLYGKSGIAGAMPPLANVVISNVPGPPVPLYVAGMRMSGYWPLSIVEHGVGLNITLISYAGTLGIGFTAARSAVPEPAELVTDLMAAWEELRAAAIAPAAKSALAPRRRTRKAAHGD